MTLLAMKLFDRSIDFRLFIKINISGSIMINSEVENRKGYWELVLSIFCHKTLFILKHIKLLWLIHSLTSITKKLSKYSTCQVIPSRSQNFY